MVHYPRVSRLPSYLPRADGGIKNAQGLCARQSHGGDKGIRTLGLCLAKAALSQLSYIPVAVLIVAIRSRYVNDYAGKMK